MNNPGVSPWKRGKNKRPYQTDDVDDITIPNTVSNANSQSSSLSSYSSSSSLLWPCNSHVRLTRSRLTFLEEERLVMEKPYDGSSSQFRYRRQGSNEYIAFDQGSPLNDDTLSLTSSNPSDSCSSINPNILEFLPESVIAKCLFDGYIDSIATVKTLSVVSKEVARIAKETVKMLDLRRCLKIYEADVASLVSRFQNLSHLDFGYCEQFSDQHLQKLLPITKTLQVLHLKGSSITGDGFIRYLNATKQVKYCGDPGGSSMLQDLDLGSTMKAKSCLIGNDAVNCIVDHCPNLCKLSLSWCTAVTDSSIPSLSRLRRLADLDVSLTSITSRACYTLASMPSLKRLNLDATAVDGRGVHVLITGRDPSTLPHPSLVGGHVPQATTAKSRLEKISLRFIDGMSSQTLDVLRLHCPSLSVLNLTHLEGLDLDSPSIQSRIKCLKQRGCVVITDIKNDIKYDLY